MRGWRKCSMQMWRCIFRDYFRLFALTSGKLIVFLSHFIYNTIPILVYTGFWFVFSPISSSHRWNRLLPPFPWNQLHLAWQGTLYPLHSLLLCLLHFNSQILFQRHFFPLWLEHPLHLSVLLTVYTLSFTVNWFFNNSVSTLKKKILRMHLCYSWDSHTTLNLLTFSEFVLPDNCRGLKYLVILISKLLNK